MINFDPLMPILFAGILIATLWNHLWCIVLLGFGRQWLIAKILAVEIAVIFVAGCLLVPSGGSVGMAESVLCAIVPLSGLIFPFVGLKELRRLKPSPVGG